MIKASLSVSPNANGWDNSPVTVSFTVTDADSPITSQSGCATATLSNEAPAAGTTLNFTCADVLSGVDVPGASYVKSAEGAGQSQAYACLDLSESSSGLSISGINIDKTAPTVSAVTGLPNPVMVNAAFSLQASLSDGGPSGLGLAEYRIDASRYLTLGPVSGTAATETGAACSFAAPTVANSCVRATDLAGNTSAEECAPVAVYAPNGGFVTGGGTIQSPAGSLTAQLVVAGARAQYKGEGVIKGVSRSFSFLLTAIDGDQPGGGGQDKFRLKVFAEGGGVVYDNNLNLPDSSAPSTVIESGSIQVHKN